MFGMKFPIRISLTCWPKRHTEARNFPLKGRKLLFLLFEINFLNVYRQDYIFGGNVKREKLLPIKFSIRALSTI